MKNHFSHGFPVIVALVIILSAAMPVTASSQPASLAANQPPIITVWYEPFLKFGQIGNPQRQVNILGNVSDPDGSVTSLTYSLNNGPDMPLTIGPDKYRLLNPGDFNVSIDMTGYNSGVYNLLLKARDNTNTLQTKQVAFSFTNGKTWPMPYATHWSSAASIQDQAQVVDGLWKLTSGGVEPVYFGYDRLIDIGDMGWTDYTIQVPVTVHAYYQNPIAPDAGVGIIARWQGHIGPGQPPTGWSQLGAYGFISPKYKGLALQIDPNRPVSERMGIVFEQTYILKLKVETTSQGGRYSFKAWEQGQPEPDWSAFPNIYNVVDSGGDLSAGSMLLVSHKTDATFGDVVICPLTNPTFKLTVNTVGNGSVSPQPAAVNNTYTCGDSVILTATPAPGWYFSGWTGDYQSTSSNLSFSIAKANTITANFSEGVPNQMGQKLFLPLVTR